MANDAGSNSAALRVMASKALQQNGVTQTPESLAAMIAQMQQGPDDSVMGNFNPDTMQRTVAPELDNTVNPTAPPPVGNGNDAGRSLILTPPAAGGGSSSGGAAPQPQPQPDPTALLAAVMKRANPPHMKTGDDINYKIGQANVQDRLAQPRFGMTAPGPVGGAGPLAAPTVIGGAMLPEMMGEALPALLRTMLPRAFQGGEAGGAVAGGSEAAGGAAKAGEEIIPGGEAGAEGGAEAGAEPESWANGGEEDMTAGSSQNTEAAMREIVTNPTPENVAQVAKQWPEDVQRLIDSGDLSPEMYDSLGMKPALDSPGYTAWRMFRTSIGRGGKGSAKPNYLNSIME